MLPYLYRGCDGIYLLKIKDRSSKLLRSFFKTKLRGFMNYQYHVRMADLHIRIISEYAVEFDERSRVFLEEPVNSPDIYYFIEDKEYDVSFAKLLYKAVKYCIYEQDGEYIWQFHDMGDEFILRCEDEKRTRFRIYIKRAVFDRINSIILVNFFALEGAMLHYHAFWLHASFVRWRDKGILFSAPSGTGKSTQAELWKQYRGADILNGDRTLIRCADGAYRGYGSIYAGSSGIYRNESAPIRAAVILRQGKENRLERMDAKEAFRCIYSQSLSNPWNPSYVSELIEQIMDFISTVPVYRLTCLPDEAAVELLCSAIEAV